MARDLYARLFHPNICSSKNQRDERKDSTQQTYQNKCSWYSLYDSRDLTFLRVWDVKGHGDSWHQVSFVCILDYFIKTVSIIMTTNTVYCLVVLAVSSSLVTENWFVLCHRLKSPRSIKLEFDQSYVVKLFSQQESIEAVAGVVLGLLPQCQISEMLQLSSCWIMSNRIDESAPTIDSFDDERWSKVGTWKQVNGYTIICQLNWETVYRTSLTEISN